ncbi:MAG TPA: FtsX-like permease family protein [Actinomycetes bacterium]|nr:FtsX-like permease family protein [Actinomycetes bacterium]
MFTATLKSLLARKLRLLLSALAVVLGVLAVSGALVLTDTLGRSFDALFQTVNQNLDVQVTGAQHVQEAERGGDPVTTPIPAETVGRVAAVPGVQSAIGAVIADGARVIGHDGKVIGSSGPPRFGVGWRGEVGFTQLRTGRGPAAPEEVAIDAGLAKQGNFTVGDKLGVLTLQPKKTFTLVGIFGYTGGRDSLGGETRVAFTEPVAQQLLLGKRGVYSVVNVQAQQGISPAELRDAIQAGLGGGYVVRTRQQVAADQASDVEGFLGFIRAFLLGFAGVALFVGAFLILNTFSILVAQRTRELALLRSLGASRGQVLRSVLVEAVLVGLLAATLGLLAGLGVAALLRAVMQAQSGLTFPDAALTLPGSAVVASYLVGVLVTVVAALLPALRASRVPPVAALRDAATPDRPLTGLTVAGSVPALLGVAAVGAALFGDLGDATLPALLGGVLLTFVGVAMLTPAISRPAVAALGRLLAWSTPGKLGQRNAARNPRRTAVTAAALMVGIALVTGVSVLASSLQASLQGVVRQSLAAELIIAGDDIGGPSAATYDPTVIDQAKRLPGVAQAVAVHADVAQLGSDATDVAAGDLPAMATIFRLKATAGQLRTLRKGELVVDDGFANDHNLAVGETVELATQRRGPTSYTVVGVFARSRLVPGPLLLSLDDATAGFRSPQANFGYIHLQQGADAPAIQQRVAALLTDNPEVAVRSQADFLAQLTSQVDTAVVMLYVLLGLSIVIAVLGIINTLALSILERTRELGLVRAVGMGRSQVMQMVAVESIVIAVFGALLGVLVGAALGTAVVRAVPDEFVSVLSLPWRSTAVLLALAVIVGLAAAILPAARAARTDVLRAIAYE